jgi:hypothetical protein
LRLWHNSGNGFALNIASSLAMLLRRVAMRWGMQLYVEISLKR